MKPTIAELEKLMDSPDLDLKLLPNGEVRSFNWRERIKQLESELEIAISAQGHEYQLRKELETELANKNRAIEMYRRFRAGPLEE